MIHNTTMQRLAAFAAALLFCVSLAGAQPTRGAPPARGLDSLGDDAVMADLGARQMEKLQDFAFEQLKIPEAKRNTLRGVAALRDLLDDQKLKTLSPSAKRDLIAKAVAGISAVLPTMKDFDKLSKLAGVIGEGAVQSDVNRLEYFGDDDRTRAKMRPAAEAVVLIFQRAVAVAGDACSKVVNAHNPNQPLPAAALRQWEEWDKKRSLAQYSMRMAEYWAILAMDKADNKRNQRIDQAIKGLAEWDDPTSDVQASIRNRIGKLLLAKGDFVKAKGMFDSVKDNRDGQIKPAPTADEQFEARYFSVQCDLAARKGDLVKAAIPDLRKWVQDVLVKDPAVAKSGTGKIYDATVSMLEYRLKKLEEEIAADAAAKAKARDEATAILLKIQTDVPELGGLIREQLLATLPEKADYKTLDPLTLYALLVRASGALQQETLTDESRKLLQQGIDAAEQLVALAGGTTRHADISADMLDDAMLQPGNFYEKLGKKVEAAKAFAEFAIAAPTEPKEKFGRGKDAAYVAGRLLLQLRGDEKLTTEQQAAVQAIWGRYLLGPVKKFKIEELYFDRGRYNQSLGQLREAIEDFKLVSASSSRAAYARFYQCLAVDQLAKTDKQLSDAEKKILKQQVEALAGDTVRLVDVELKKNPEENRRLALQGLKVKARLQGINVILTEGSDTAKVFQMLDVLEKEIVGLPEQRSLSESVIQIRLLTHIKARDMNAAITLLEQLQKANPGAAAGMIDAIFVRIRKELAEVGDDAQRKQQLILARGGISGFMLDRAIKNKDPELYRYYIFDAESKLRAALLEPNAATKKELLEKVKTNYQWALSSDGQKAYEAALKKKAPRDGDPSARYGLGLTEYELGNHKEAKQLLVNLVAGGQLGGPVTIDANGDEVENEPYWEATYKMLDSTVKLEQKDQAKAFLRLLFIQFGPAVGGRAWGEAIENLRKAYFPDLNPQQLMTRPAAAPATAPAEVPAK